MESSFNYIWKMLQPKILKEELLQWLADIVRIPSYRSVEEGETRVAEYLARLFQQNGIEAQIKPVLNHRCNILARIPGVWHKPALLLTGHLDTVPVYAESQRGNEREIPDLLHMVEKEGFVYGRGVVDMKGAVICMVTALIAIKRANVQLEGDVYFAGVIGEETASEGSCALVEEGIQWDAAIVGEPTQLEIALGHRGLEWLDFEIEGKAVHSGYQERGVNAIEYMKKWMNYLEKEIAPQLTNQNHPIMKNSVFNLGTIQGGTQPSTVAGKCVLQLDVRWVPPFTHAQILSLFRDATKKFQEHHPMIKITQIINKASQMSHSMVHETAEIPTSHPIIKSLQQAGKLVDKKSPKTTYFRAWTDAGVLNSYGRIPTVIFGPGDLTSAHSEEEYVEIDQLMRATKMYIAVCLLYCKLQVGIKIEE